MCDVEGNLNRSRFPCVRNLVEGGHVIMTSWRGAYGRPLAFLGRLPAAVPEYLENWGQACAHGYCLGGKCHLIPAATQVCLYLRRMLRRSVFGMFLTKIHLTTKVSFHLSDVHTSCFVSIQPEDRSHNEGTTGWWSARYPPALASPPPRRSDRCRND